MEQQIKSSNLAPVQAFAVYALPEKRRSVLVGN
jgi:hypothetical protein